MELNKNTAILGGIGIGVTCLFAGGFGGFAFAKKQIENALPDIISKELAETRAHYETRLKQLRMKPSTPDEALSRLEKAREERGGTPLSDQKLASQAADISDTQGYKRRETPAVAYNRIVQEREAGAHIINEKNIWKDQPEDDREPPKSLRGPNGKFVSPRKALSETEVSETPNFELITDEDFLGDTMGYDQRNLKFYVDSENPDVGTLIDHHHPEIDDLVVDVDDVGGYDLLALLPGSPENESGEKAIFVRSHGESTDFEIVLSYEDLAEVQDAKQS